MNEQERWNELGDTDPEYSHRPMSDLLYDQVPKGLTRKENDALAAIMHDETASKVERQQARNDMIVGNMAIALAESKRWRSLHMPLEDLIQSAHMFLIDCVDGFDPSYGFAFSTYSISAFRLSFRSTLGKQIEGRLRLPGHIQSTYLRLHHAINKLGINTSIDSLIEHMNGQTDTQTQLDYHTKENIVLLLDYHNNVMVDGDHVTGDDNSLSLFDAIADPGLDPIQQAEAELFVRNAFDAMTTRQRQVVEMFYGIGTDQLSSLDIIEITGGTRQNADSKIKKGLATAAEKLDMPPIPKSAAQIAASERMKKEFASGFNPLAGDKKAS